MGRRQPGYGIDTRVLDKIMQQHKPMLPSEEQAEDEPFVYDPMGMVEPLPDDPAMGEQPALPGMNQGEGPDAPPPGGGGIDPSLMAALAKSGAQMGTLGGKASDTSAVSNYANILEKRKMMGDRRRATRSQKLQDWANQQKGIKSRENEGRLNRESRERIAEATRKSKEGMAQNKLSVSMGKNGEKRLGDSQQKRHDNIQMGIKAIKGMDAALTGGENTFSLMGDNNFTMHRTAWEEAIGRMQSGGAINDEEADRFRNMMPGPLDSAEIQQAKLNKMLDEMNTRGKAFDIYSDHKMAYGDPNSAGPGMLDESTAIAGPSAEEDNEAIQWAKANPNDPRAAKILQGGK